MLYLRKGMLPKKLLEFIIIAYPYIFALNIGFFIYGFNVPFVSIVTIGLFLVFTNYILSKKDIFSFFVICIIAFLVMIVAFTRSAVYFEDINLAQYRSFFLVVVYSVSLKLLLSDADFKSKISKILLFNFVAQAVIGIIHSLYFPHIVTGIELDNSGAKFYVLDPGEGGFRESGLLIGSNVYGNFLVLGIFLIIGHLRGATIFRLFFLLFSAFLIFWAIYLSGSRLALANGFLISFVVIVRHFGIKYFSVPVIFALLVVLTTSVFDNVIERTESHGSGGRVEKAELAINMLSDSMTSMFLGPSLAVLANTKTFDGLQFSDNSFMHLALQHGVFISIVCFIVVFYSVARNVKGSVVSILMCYYIITTLYFNNSILWDIWLLYAIAVMYILAGRPSLNKIENVA